MLYSWEISNSVFMSLAEQTWREGDLEGPAMTSDNSAERLIDLEAIKAKETKFLT